jgi:hypothetical protein
MKIKRFFEALPVVAALLLAPSCSNEDNDMLVPQPETPAVKTIPFTVTVSTNTDTRATLADTYNGYVFAEGDALYVQDASGDVYGMLTLDSGEGTGNATFSGELNYTGSEPEATLALTAVLKGKDDVIVQVENDKVTDIVYPADAIQKPSDTEPIVAVASLQEAIQKFSYFKGTATYGAPSFTLEQQSAFLHFSISVANIDVYEKLYIDLSVVNNVSEDNPNGEVISYWFLELDEDGKTEFYTALASGTKLENAEIMPWIPVTEQCPNIKFGDGIQLEANRVYKVTKRLVDLSWIKSDFEAQNGDVLFGWLAYNFDNFDEVEFKNHVISIPAEAKVTLSNAYINVDDIQGLNLPCITCADNATIILEGDNFAIGSQGPGIFVPSGNTLTIKGTGFLQANGGTIEEATSTTGQGAAGIGSGYGEDCGNIVILEGTIEATGGYGAPGIGSGMNGTCGDITFSGGDIMAFAGEAAPTAIGIGTGGTCASVTIVNTISSIAMTNSDATDNKVSSFINATKIQAHGGSNTLDIKSFATYNVDDANFATTGMNHVGLTSTYDSENYTWTVSK